MQAIQSFLRQRAPKADDRMPSYYQRALSTSEIALSLYFLLCCLLLSWANRRLEWAPALAFGAMALCRYSIGRVNSRASLHAFEVVILLWCTWHTYAVGWSYGAQHLLIPTLMLCFFNIYEPPWMKIVSFLIAVALRLALFAWSLDHPGIYALSRPVVILYQTMSSLMLFNVLAICFITFSSSIQESERQLTINNQELHREAGTDPLTQLPNRRALLDAAGNYMKKNSDEAFTLAIADIDFFKKVNDTYGHQCGDYTLKTLADLFKTLSAGKYMVCRWGGEEFCFFLPGMNLDHATIEMQNLNSAVRKMPLRYGDTDFNITITIGAEENDFKSSLEDILDRADRKLYMGKVHGRDQVVI